MVLITTVSHKYLSYKKKLFFFQTITNHRNNRARTCPAPRMMQFFF